MLNHKLIFLVSALNPHLLFAFVVFFETAFLCVALAVRELQTCLYVQGPGNCCCPGCARELNWGAKTTGLGTKVCRRSNLIFKRGKNFLFPEGTYVQQKSGPYILCYNVAGPQLLFCNNDQGPGWKGLKSRIKSEFLSCIQVRCAWELPKTKQNETKPNKKKRNQKPKTKHTKHLSHKWRNSHIVPTF